MSSLINGITFVGPYVDPRIRDKITISSTVEIPLPLQEAFSRVLWAVAAQLQKESRPFGNQSVSCIFSDSDHFSVALDSDEIAVCMRIAFYPLDKMAPYLGTIKLYAILAEELCHLIWDISDEVEVNFKVLAVLRHLNPNIQMSDLYSEDTVRSCERYLQDHPAFQP